jgi:hypothetical protein
MITVDEFRGSTTRTWNAAHAHAYDSFTCAGLKDFTALLCSAQCPGIPRNFTPDPDTSELGAGHLSLFSHSDFGW